MMNTYAHLKTSSAGGTVLAATDMLCSHRSPPRPIAMEHRTLNTPILVQQRGRGERKRSTTFRLLLPATPKTFWKGVGWKGDIGGKRDPPPSSVGGLQTAAEEEKGQKKRTKIAPLLYVERSGENGKMAKRFFFTSWGEESYPNFDLPSALC